MANTSIEWTDVVWNPVRGCTKVSPGCKHCYAETFAERFRGVAGHPYEQGFDLRLVPEKLDWPLRWRGSRVAFAEGRPSRVFVNSMSDLFQDGVPDDFIVAVFGTMLAAMQHTYQVLTKRPERMLAWHRWLNDQGGLCAYIRSNPDRLRGYFKSGSRFTTYRGEKVRSVEDAFCMVFNAAACWGTPPLPNVHLGVSCENQETADERIPLLLQTPAAIRFVSAEPLLGAIDFTPWLQPTTTHHMGADVEGMLRNHSFDFLRHDDGRPMTRREAEDELYALHAKGVAVISCGGCDAFDPKAGCPGHANPRLDWVIVGGESGPGARLCDVAWIRPIVAQCRAANVACFVKQLGAHAHDGALHLSYSWTFGCAARELAVGIAVRDRKGGTPSEWPEDLRVREMPRMEERA